MMITTPYTKSAADGWFLVADGSPDVLVQIRSAGFLEVVMAPASPANATDIWGHMLDNDGDTSFSASGLEVADKVYVCVKGTLSVTYAVTQNGAALP